MEQKSTRIFTQIIYNIPEVSETFRICTRKHYQQQELQDILLQFYRKKTDSLLLQFQKEHGITQDTLDEWANQHERTLYGNR